MIRNDIKKFLENKNLEEIFLQNRVGVDQPGYRVGKVDFDGKQQIIVWNPNTNLFMDYFYDDIVNNWFDTELIFSLDKQKRYKVNKDGRVLGRSGKLLNKRINNWGYPEIKLGDRWVPIHKIYGLLFIPNYNPSICKFIDHIDRDQLNYSLSNLRWVTASENSLNRNYPKEQRSNNLYYAYEDKTFTKLYKIFTEETISELDNKHNINYIRNAIKKSAKRSNKTRYYGFYWKYVDLDLKDYLESVGYSYEIDQSLWKLHYSNAFYVHPAGIIKNNRGNITAGSIIGVSNRKERHYQTTKFNCSKRIHILVAEVFLNDNKPLKPGLVVDHIDTNSLNNCKDNLKICSQKENMNNPNTIENIKKGNLKKEKYRIKVIDPEGNIYDSTDDCGKAHNIPRWKVVKLCNNPKSKFNYYNPNLT